MRESYSDLAFADKLVLKDFVLRRHVVNYENNIKAQINNGYPGRELPLYKFEGNILTEIDNECYEFQWVQIPKLPEYRVILDNSEPVTLSTINAEDEWVVQPLATLAREVFQMYEHLFGKNGFYNMTQTEDFHESKEIHRTADDWRTIRNKRIKITNVNNVEFSTFELTTIRNQIFKLLDAPITTLSILELGKPGILIETSVKQIADEYNFSNHDAYISLEENMPYPKYQGKMNYGRKKSRPKNRFLMTNKGKIPFTNAKIYLQQSIKQRVKFPSNQSKGEQSPNLGTANLICNVIQSEYARFSGVAAHIIRKDETINKDYMGPIVEQLKAATFRDVQVKTNLSHNLCIRDVIDKEILDKTIKLQFSYEGDLTHPKLYIPSAFGDKLDISDFI